MFHFKLPHTKTHSLRAVTQQPNARSSDVTPAPAPSGKQILTNTVSHTVSHAFKMMYKTIRRVSVANFSGGSSPLPWMCALVGVDVVRRGLSVCAFMNALMWVYVCVFVGLSGEPGQSVRCGNGGFKDECCGEFPGCLLPTHHPSSPNPCHLDADRHTGRHLDR